MPSGERLPDTLPAAPTGQVTVTGYLRRSEHGNDNAINPIDHRMRLINAPAIGAAMGGQPVLDGYVAQTDIVPAGDGTLKPFVTPELSEGNHFSYALQWFTFSAIAVFGGAVYFIRSDLKDRRKRRAATAAAAEQPPPGLSVLADVVDLLACPYCSQPLEQLGRTLRCGSGGTASMWPSRAM